MALFWPFIYANLTFHSIDRSTDKKCLCDSNFEMHFLREKF